MKADKRRRLRKAGWTVADSTQFLGLTPEEAAVVEIHVSLALGLRRRRQTLGLTQADLARRIGSSQSRVAKMEAVDPTVSMDLLVKALVAVGANRREIGRLVAA